MMSSTTFSRVRLVCWAALTLSISMSLAASVAHAATLRGYVTDAQTGSPIAGAWVTLQASAVRETTNALGFYEIEVPDNSGVLAAAHAGYFTAGMTFSGTSTVDFALTAIASDPDDPNALLPLPPATACQGCHTQQVHEWETSRMAHAGQNRWVEDLYAGTGTDGGMNGFVYTRDSVHASTNPMSECASCHQPSRWLDEPFVAYEGHANASNAAREGVTCATCHLMAHVDESAIQFPGVFPGVVTFTRNQTVRYGVLGDVTYHAPGRMRAALQPQLTSVVCATCHQDANDPSGTGAFDGPLSEPTYSEWKNSPYADPASPLFQSCMGCHSEATNATSASTLQETAPRPPGQIRSHTFEGTTPAFLRRAVSLSLDVEKQNDRIIAHVKLRNTGAGHHVPTGVTIRNMILIVEASDANGPLDFLGDQRVDPLGGVGPVDQGYYADLPGKLYAKINESAAGDQAVLFTEAVRIDRDTRLEPLQEDVLAFPFAVTPDSDVRLHVRVIYRRAWRALIDQKGWTRDGLGKALADLQAPHYGVLMAEASWNGRVNVEPSEDVEPTDPSDDDLVVPTGGGCQSVSMSPTPSGGLIVLWITVSLVFLEKKKNKAASSNVQHAA